MRFYNYETLYSACRRAGELDANKMSWDKWYPFMRHQANAMGDNVAVTQLGLEHNWTLAKQPYYNVWPAIIPPLPSSQSRSFFCLSQTAQGRIVDSASRGKESLEV